MVKLAHQFEPNKDEINNETKVGSSEQIVKSYPRRKKNTPKSLTERQHILTLNKSKLGSASKTAPHTPSHTPSPQESPERPLTPSTPPGLSLPVNKDSANVSNIQASSGNIEKARLPSSSSSSSSLSLSLSLSSSLSSKYEKILSGNESGLDRPLKKTMTLNYWKKEEESKSSIKSLSHTLKDKINSFNPNFSQGHLANGNYI